MNIFNNIVEWIKNTNLVTLISFVISLIALYFSTNRFFWDRNDRVLKFIASIRWWKFGKEDISKLLLKNPTLKNLSKEDYIAININNNTGVMIDKCMLLFKPTDKTSWKKYCNELIKKNLADYIIFCGQLSPMPGQINRYVLNSEGINNMDVAICVKDTNGIIWLKASDNSLVKLNKKTYQSLIGLKGHYSLSVVASQIVAKAMGDPESLMFEIDSDFKSLGKYDS